MKIRSGGRWSAAFVCVFMLAGSAAAAESVRTTEALRGLALRIDAATRETLAAHAEHRAIRADIADAAKRARGEFDAIARAADASDIAFARKQRQVGKLLANLERAEAAAADATLPALVATSDPSRTARVAIASGQGASCASALTLAPGHAIETNLAAAGGAGSTLWLRVAPSKEGYTRLDTTPTALDTEITLFGATCPASEAEATARNDDAFGLAAAIAMNYGTGVRVARIRNLGGAGRVVARFDTQAAILGRITDERNGQPLAANVESVTPEGFFGLSTVSDAGSGLYLLTVDPGTYYVGVDSPWAPTPGYVPELYPDAPCAGPVFYGLMECDTASATQLTLADGQQRADIDVALNIGGRIAGVVRSTTDGSPIAQAVVSVFDPTGFTIANASTDVAGRYTVAGLLTGNYYILAGAQGYGAQLWDHIACGQDGTFCQPTTGTPLGVVRDELTNGIDFDLPRQTHIHATVSARDGAGVPLDYWSLFVYSTDGTFQQQFSVYGSTVDAGPLPPGSYRAFASAVGYFGQVWDGIDCMSDCSAELAQGDVIALATGAEADVSFALLSIPTVSGTITDATTHAPIANAQVGLVAVGQSYSATYAYTDITGHFTLAPIMAGDFYVWSLEALHRTTVYPAAPCTGDDFSTCDLTTATPVTIAYGGPDLTGADIAMPVDGSISGHVTIHVPDGVTLPSPVPLTDSIYVQDADGNYFAWGSMQVDGSYSVVGLPAGTYYAVSSGYGFAQAYEGVDCGINCGPAQGTPIMVAQGQDVTGIDFDPMPSDYIFGRVTDQGGAGVAGVTLDLWNAGDASHCGVGVTNADGYYALENTTYLCPGLSRVSTDIDPSRYENQVYDGILCPAGSVYLGLCSLDGGTDITLPTTPVFVFANFVLGPQPDPIFGSGFDP